MFFNSPKYSSSETRRPKNSSPSSLLHRCSKFRPFSCSAAPPTFQESRKLNRGQPSSALTNFQGNGSETKPTSFRAAASWSFVVFLKARKRVLDLLFRLLPCQLLLMYPKEMLLKARKRVLDLLFLLLPCQLLMMHPKEIFLKARKRVLDLLFLLLPCQLLMMYPKEMFSLGRNV